MTDKAKENESLEDIIEYEGPFGMEGDSDTFWDDFEQELKEQILKNKITKVKIYYNSDKDEEEKHIIGIGFTFENMFTGEIKELEHKGSEAESGMKELVLKIQMFHFRDYHDKNNVLSYQLLFSLLNVHHKKLFYQNIYLTPHSFFALVRHNPFFYLYSNHY